MSKVFELTTETIERNLDIAENYLRESRNLLDVRIREVKNSKDKFIDLMVYEEIH